MGEIALKIRQVGAENAVPIIEAAPLARALYRHVDLDQEIPATLYAAVAEVLAYIYQLSQLAPDRRQLSDATVGDDGS
jgi:flagellar biosynthetic protein FlhB